MEIRYLVSTAPNIQETLDDIYTREGPWTMERILAVAQEDKKLYKDKKAKLYKLTLEEMED